MLTHWWLQFALLKRHSFISAIIKISKNKQPQLFALRNKSHLLQLPNTLRFVSFKFSWCCQKLCKYLIFFVHFENRDVSSYHYYVSTLVKKVVLFCCVKVRTQNRKHAVNKGHLLLLSTHVLVGMGKIYRNWSMITDCKKREYLQSKQPFKSPYIEQRIKKTYLGTFFHHTADGILCYSCRCNFQACYYRTDRIRRESRSCLNFQHTQVYIHPRLKRNANKYLHNCLSIVRLYEI